MARSLPTEDEVWRSWLRFLSSLGEIEADPLSGVTLSWQGHDGQHLSVLRASSSELYAALMRHLEARRRLGLSRGPEEGLPQSMWDSFGDAVGPQTARHAEFVIVDLEIVPAPGSDPYPAVDLDLPPGVELSWFPADEVPEARRV